MSLVTSLIISDGIIIAGDSLSTARNKALIKGTLDIECPKCKHQHTVEQELEAAFPASSFSYAQKVFPFMDNYGIGAVGKGQIAGKTVYFAVKELENELRERSENLGGVKTVVEKIGSRLHKLVKVQIEDIQGQKLKEAPDNWYPIKLHVVGYDNSKAKIIGVYIGKEVETEEHDKQGCTVLGQDRVCKAIWDLYDKFPKDQAAIEAFSLQDAIDYAEFLISTTTKYQRFSRSIGGVGGEIDIGLVTPFNGFRWIQQKELAQALEGGVQNAIG